MEKFNKGFASYNHNLVCNFSEILRDSIALFKQYGSKHNIEIKDFITNGIFIKADPLSINRIINNLVENAVKFSKGADIIEIALKHQDDTIFFTVKDFGGGIPVELQAKVFEPYYQLTNHKRNTQGMGPGLPIVKKVIDDLNGDIKIISNPKFNRGTEMVFTLNRYEGVTEETVVSNFVPIPVAINEEKLIEEAFPDEAKQSILVVEDNITMINYLIKKLREKYNVHAALNGNDALRKMKELSVIPDLIITDVMMDKVDGLSLEKP